MKAISKTFLISCLALFTTVVSYGQEFQGKAYYFSKTTMDLGNFGGRQMSEEMKKQIEDRMKSMFERTYVLTFNKEASIYKEEEQLEAPGQVGGRGFGRMMMGSFTGGTQYKNVKDKKMLQEQEFFGKQFLINDELQNLEWKLGGETKQIGQYLCMKATAMKKTSEFDFSSFRGRGRGDNNNNEESNEPEIPEEVEVVAWYTPQIPVNQGPGEYWGLPGLILEVSSGRTTILCSKIVLNPEEKEEIKMPSKGKEVTQTEYNQIVKEKTEEMRNMRFRGRQGGSRRQ